jgi:hypothetical protein
MDDDEAYMELGLGNTQGELTPLEVGLHAYGAVELGKGGRSSEGGISAYARHIGRTKGYLSQLVAAAQVYQAIGKPFTRVNSFTTRTKHLYEISRLPQEHWAALVERMLAEEWSVEQTRTAVEELSAVVLSDEELLDLKRAVRRRGGTYHGNRTINGVVTRHHVTLPGQPQRQYLTQHLRDLLTSFPEREEALPDDLVAAWSLEEHEADLRARHTATGVTTDPGTLWQVSVEARSYQPGLDRLHAAGWTFRRDTVDWEMGWEAHHERYGAVQDTRIPMLVRRADRAEDVWWTSQVRELMERQEWDEAERTILRLHDPSLKDELMAAFRACL